MLNSILKPLSLTALAALCGLVAAPQNAAAAPATGAVFAPDTLPAGVFSAFTIHKVQTRRSEREGRRIVRRDRRGVRRGRRLFMHKHQRYRGHYLAAPRLPIPYQAYGTTPYYDYPATYDPDFDNTYDYVPAPPPRGNNCARWAQRCAASWGHGNPDFHGCMRYHGCN